MPTTISFSKRQAFCTVVIVVALSLAIIVIRDRKWHQEGLPTVTELASHAARLPALPELSRDQGRSDAAAVQGAAALPDAQGIAKTSKHGDFPRTPDYKILEVIQRTALGSLSDIQLENLYFNITEQQHIQCPSSKRIGDSIDGGWDVCFSDPFDIRKSRPCVAFSFGINSIWGYDDQLADKYNCMVYMFDPSMKAIADHQRKNTSWFYLTGLSSNNNVTSDGWKMRTLCRLFKDLGYAGKPVDILKVDIEYWEWDSFEQAMRDGCLRHVKQLLFESHTREMQGKRSDYVRFIRVWLGLIDLGFRTWKWHKNPQSVFYKSGISGVTRACCYEHYMINTNLL